MPGIRVENKNVPSSVVVWVKLPMGPVIVTCAPGTTALVVSYTRPPRLPRAELWSCATTVGHIVPTTDKTKINRSDRFLMRLVLLSVVVQSERLNGFTIG